MRICSNPTLLPNESERQSRAALSLARGASQEGSKGASSCGNIASCAQHSWQSSNNWIAQPCQQFSMLRSASLRSSQDLLLLSAGHIFIHRPVSHPLTMKHPSCRAPLEKQHIPTGTSQACCIQTTRLWLSNTDLPSEQPGGVLQVRHCKSPLESQGLSAVALLVCTEDSTDCFTLECNLSLLLGELCAVQRTDLSPCRHDQTTTLFSQDVVWL